jgi:S-DNA-T family DNA segregation ATPase FtsK/SpoIIIE
MISHARIDAWLALVVVASGCFGILTLRRRSPRWYWIVVGYPMCWVRMMRTWRALCVQCLLTTSRRPGRAIVGDLVVRGEALRPVFPRLRIGLPHGSGLVASVPLRPGQTPAEFQQASEAMAHAWRVHAVRVSSPRRGFVHLTVLALDPLGAVIERADGEQGSKAERRRWGGMRAAAESGQPNLSLLVGVREDGRAWMLDLRRVPHWLITGATQSGKSTLIHAAVVRLAPLPGVALVGIDLKGGMELSLYAPRLSALATSRAEAADLLAGLVNLALARMDECKRAGVRTVWDLPTMPPLVVVIVDEVAELYLLGDRAEKDQRDRASTALLRLAQLGAALGIHLLISGQRVGSDLGPGLTALRAQLGGRICHHVADPESAVMTLGDVFPDAVDTAQMITPEQRGCAVTTDDAGGWLRARSTYTTAEQAADTARQHAHLTPVLPGVSSPSGEGGEIAWS